MEVEPIEFVPRDCVNGPQNIFHREPISADIHIKSSMLKLGGICYGYRGHVGVDSFYRVLVEQLSEGFQCMKDANV